MKDDQTGGAGAPTYAEALRVWLKIGLLSFGGPAGQIALMHKELVEDRKWIDEQRYLHALNFCTLLPGPEAMQLATYVGWRLHGVKGGLTAGLLFVIPGALVVLALAMLYAAFGKVAIVSALFVGIKAAVLAVVVEALMRIARRGLKTSLDWVIAAAAFLTIFFLDIPFWLIVVAALAFGFVRGLMAPGGGSTSAAAAAPVAVSTAATLRTAAIWIAIWVVPLAALVAILGPGHVIAKMAWFFSWLAVVTFGGAYTVLAQMVQEIASNYKWLTHAEMVDGLGLAETTPGPLILVTEFVGFLAAFRHGGANPWAMGVLGAVVTVWATFAPCFLYIFVGAPYIERLQAEPRLKSALAAVMAAAVGVILYLSVWFALHVLFRTVAEKRVWPFRLAIPEWASIDWRACVLAALAFAMMFGLHQGIIPTLIVCAGLAMGWHWLAG